MTDIKWVFFIAGVVVGWITKVPFLIKWYREFEKEKQINARMREYLNREQERGT